MARNYSDSNMSEILNGYILGHQLLEFKKTLEQIAQNSKKEIHLFEKKMSILKYSKKITNK